MEKLKEGKRSTKRSATIIKKPRSIEIAARGISTSKDFANLMSTLMSDIIEGRVSPSVGNATCNAGGKLLKIVELQYKYGTPNKDNSSRVLVLSENV